MPLTPVEIRHQELKRSVLGYKRTAVDRLMTEVADSFELVWRERAELADRVEVLDAEVKRHLELEGLLRQTLVSAERAAEEVKERARREAELIVSEAHAEARSITRDAIAEKQRLLAESYRVQALLRGALQIVDDAAHAGDAAAATETPGGEQRPGPVPAPATDRPDESTDPDVRRLAG